MSLRNVMDSDRGAILSDWDSASYTPKGSPHNSADTVADINGIITMGFIEVNGVETTKKVFTCSQADIPSAAQGGRLTVDSNEYLIAHSEPDGVGFISLFLDDF